MVSILEVPTFGLVDFCRRMRQINTSASSTVRSAKSNPRDALQTC
jgi:hypothetical protein